MELFKKEKELKHEIPLDQIPYNADAIKEKLRRTEQKKRNIKILLVVTEVLLGALSIFLILSYWSSKKAVGIEWGRMLDSYALHINTNALVFLERIYDNYSVIINRIAANTGRYANARIILGAGQIQSRFKDNTLLFSSVFTVLGLRITKNLNFCVGLGWINDVISENMRTVSHGISQMCSKLIANKRVVHNSGSETWYVLKKNWDKLISFVIKR